MTQPITRGDGASSKLAHRGVRAKGGKVSAGFWCQVPANPAKRCKAKGLKFSIDRTA